MGGFLVTKTRVYCHYYYYYYYYYYHVDCKLTMGEEGSFTKMGAYILFGAFTKVKPVKVIQMLSV